MPGHPLWHVAPKSMAWQQRSLAPDLRASSRTRAATAARRWRRCTSTWRSDTLVGWAWQPGGTREPAPGTQEQFGALIAAWIETGAACPR